MVRPEGNTLVHRWELVLPNPSLPTGRPLSVRSINNYSRSGVFILGERGDVENRPKLGEGGRLEAS